MLKIHNTPFCKWKRIGRRCMYASGEECFFEGGCSLVVEKCFGCKNMLGNSYCGVFPLPGEQWYGLGCAAGTHIKKQASEKKATLDPRKAAKQRKKKQ